MGLNYTALGNQLSLLNGKIVFTFNQKGELASIDSKDPAPPSAVNWTNVYALAVKEDGPKPRAIPLIKAYRSITGQGLRECKNAFDLAVANGILVKKEEKTDNFFSLFIYYTLFEEAGEA